MYHYVNNRLWQGLLLGTLSAGCHGQWKPVGSATLDEVTVIASSPVGGTGIPLSKFAGNVQTLVHDSLSTDTSDLAQRFNESLGSVHVNDTQGNHFSVDVNYRGFTASPVLGTPQGLSVYLDGMRINEPFGDVVSWDLLPQTVIDKVTVVPGSNPIYGLNTLGGAIALTTKSGKTFTGDQINFGIGSFGHVRVDVEHGSHTDDDNLYFAASLSNENGWATYNPSKVRQLFGKYTGNGAGWETAVSLTYADNLLYGNQAVPLSMLASALQSYSHDDYMGSQNATLNVQGRMETDSSNSYSGNLYVRYLAHTILNSNVNNVVGDSTNSAGCVVSADCPASNLLARNVQRIAGANAQWSNTDPIGPFNQILTVGINTEFSSTSFNNQGQDAWLDATNGVVGVDRFMSQADVQSDNQRVGVFATSTLDATERLSVTASARYDYASLSLAGLSCISTVGLCDATSTIVNGQLTDVSGNHSYQRFNPALGLTYLLDPHAVLFANYAEGLRTPSAIELACADPATPCSGVPNAFGADPDLQAVVSRTYEIGLRGNLSKRLVLRTSYYKTVLDNDIVFNQSSLNTGYFSNVGRTQRQGLEVGMEGHVNDIDYAIDLDWLAATYQSAFNISNQSNSAFARAVMPGDHIPGIPQWMLKLRLNYTLDKATRLGLAVQAQGPVYARGDENNMDVNGQLPGFATVKLDVNHSLGKSLNVHAGVSNLFDARYANYGTLAVNNITSGAPEQFRALGAPRTLYAGIQARF